MKNYYLFRLFPVSLLWMIFLLPVGRAQTNWEYHQNPAFHPKAVLDLAPDAGGNLWYVSGSVLGRFDGNSWTSSDFTAAGIQVQYNFLRALTHTPDGKVWCGSFNRVLEYSPGVNQWALHDPFNSATNLNGYAITADAAGKLYWSTSNGWAEWNGTQWTRNWFYFNTPLGNGIEEYSFRDVLIDQSGEAWFVTPGSIGIETGFIVPAGIIHQSATDTSVYKMGDLGYPEVLSLPVTRNIQGYPMALVGTTEQNGQVRKLQVLSYEFGAWQNLGEAPTQTATGQAIYQDPIGNVWIAGQNSPGQPVVIRRYPDGSWQTYLLDNQKIAELYTITGTPDGSIWVGGRLDTQGALARLPGQFISSTNETTAPCPAYNLICADNRILMPVSPAGDAGGQCVVYNSWGQRMTILSMNDLAEGVNVPHWPSGVYFARIETKTGCPAQTIRFIK